MSISYSNQLKLNWVWKFEKSLTKRVGEEYSVQWEKIFIHVRSQYDLNFSDMT